MHILIDSKKVSAVCEKEDINYLGLFGSFARGEENEKSDVDILINFNEVKSFFQLGRIQETLENLFNRKVDLILKDNLKESLKNYILQDLVTLYEKNNP